MTAIDLNKVQKALDLLENFDIYSNQDQVSLMAVITKLRVKREDTPEQLVQVGAALYCQYHHRRMHLLGPCNNVLEDTLMQTDVQRANAIFNELDQVHWTKIVDRSAFFQGGQYPRHPLNLHK